MITKNKRKKEKSTVSVHDDDDDDDFDDDDDDNKNKNLLENSTPLHGGHQRLGVGLWCVQEYTRSIQIYKTCVKLKYCIKITRWSV